jgi:hypothetical protein
MQKSKQHRKHSTPGFLCRNPMWEKTIEHISLCSFARTSLQFIMFHIDRNPHVVDNEDTNPLSHKPIIDDEDINPLSHQPVIDNENTNPLRNQPVADSEETNP